jgi:hypothetical protein
MEHAPAHVALEIPKFGEFARQYAGIRSQDVGSCLAAQRVGGQRIGQLLEQSGLITSDQVAELLSRQARWSANMRSPDIDPQRFPLSTPFSLCMPCYNESEVIGEVLRGACAVLPEFVDDFEIIVVDDGSSDDTSDVIRQLAADDKRIRLERHPVNRGYGAAVATALRAARGELVCFTDGDGQFNLLDLPQLLVDAQTSDVVIGYRHHRADNGMRRLNAKSWKWLIRCLVGLKVRDLDCAFKLFPRWVVEKLQLTADGACISAEILAQCMRGGLSVCEVPVNHFPRAAGKATGANLRVVAKAFRELPVVWKYRRMEPWNVDHSRLRMRAAAIAVERQIAAEEIQGVEEVSIGELSDPYATAGER